MPRSLSSDTLTISRPSLLAGIPVAALFLAGCAATDTGAATATAGATAIPTAASATPGSVAALAQAFQTTLSADQQSTLVQQYTFANAELWSNLPQGLLGGMNGSTAAVGAGMPIGAVGGGTLPTGATGSTSGAPAGGGSAGPRIGLSIGDLSDDQLAAFTALLKAATGSAAGLGYDEIQQQLNADDYLAANGGGSDYGRANFYVAFLGAPGDTGTWELQFGGHHLAVANTYTNGSLVGATPSFRGVEPFGTFDQGGTTNQPLAVKYAAFTALLAGLDAGQLASAKLSDVYSDVVLSPGNDWAFPTAHEGVQVSTFTDAQRKLTLAAIGGYVNDIADADAVTILARYTADLDSTYVAYSGTTALTEQNDYIRIDGPSVWIEFSMQHGIVLAGNHPHSVWRDRTTDYGGTKA